MQATEVPLNLAWGHWRLSFVLRSVRLITWSTISWLLHSYWLKYVRCPLGESTPLRSSLSRARHYLNFQDERLHNKIVWKFLESRILCGKFLKNFTNFKITTTSQKILSGWFAMKNRIFYGKPNEKPNSHPARIDQKYWIALYANMAYIFEIYTPLWTFWCKNWIHMCTRLEVSQFLLQ